MLYSVKFILILRRINDHDDNDEFKKHQLSLFFLFLCSSKSGTNYEELCKRLLYNKSEHYYPLSPNFFLNQFFDTVIWTEINKIPPTP